MRKSGRLTRLLAALMVGPCGVCFAEPAAPGAAQRKRKAVSRPAHDHQNRRPLGCPKIPLSSAYGPFQFLRETFLDVVRRNFPNSRPEKRTPKSWHSAQTWRSRAVRLGLHARCQLSRRSQLASVRGQPSPGVLRRGIGRAESSGRETGGSACEYPRRERHRRKPCP